ncbi:uncharacterized protein PADG_11161 [Paracoccidioides brasiliensis Pb18]|uniref:Exonuclease V, mitochondrial n=1 Tax=Paracoccidioides brasiliensis (strain Pb18) TaxID=502780 RepID=A0A0A0HU65_PARBD|nr:uncharacterized protein PADG_11161 [Paracoccidioides brasiliensis Pb18]KGM92704.1 hypothetical protein PADG_11161 [Paracoccidioides brasiliensis Pb18]
MDQPVPLDNFVLTSPPPPASALAPHFPQRLLGAPLSVSTTVPPLRLAPATALASQAESPIGDNSLDSAASSDYGSDFSPDELEELNLLLAKIRADHENSGTVPGSSSGAATPALAPVAVSASGDGSASLAAAAAAEITDQIPKIPVLLLPDIEDYAGVSSSRSHKVLGRIQWSFSSQRTGRGMPLFTDGRGRGRGRGRGNMEQGIGSWGAEHENSPEGRQKDRQRDREREMQQIAAEQNIQKASANGDSNGLVAQDKRSPLERFRTWPRKALSVTDLVSPAWCELQYWYTLTKFGRKRATPAMKQGTIVHKELEEQVHTTVPVEVMTKEDGWALRLWNVIQGLRTLRVSGMTREFEVWGNVDGEIVTGVIDQLSYECPDHELDALAEAHYADVRTSKSLFPEYQTSITEFFLSPASGGRRLSDIGVPISEQNMAPSTTTPSTPSSLQGKIYLTDIKTRGKSSGSIPSLSSTSFRPTHVQLQLYYHFLTRLVTTDDVTIEAIASRYGLQTEQPFSDSFLAQIGDLDEELFDASHDLDVDYYPPSSGAEAGGEGSQPTSSLDSMAILLEHNSLSSLWKLMKSQLRLTFLPRNSKTPPTTIPMPYQSQPQPQPHPQAQPTNNLLQDTPSLTTLLSPVLTVTYMTPSTTSDEQMQHLGSRSFLFNPPSLYNYLADEMRWWRGQRPARGVQVMEAWKCRICEFREECSWRREMEERMAVYKRKKGEVRSESGKGKGNGNGEASLVAD